MNDQPNWQEIRARLAGRWPQELIRKATKQGGKVYSYLDARDLMAFLDEVVGPGNWSTESDVVDPAACVVRCTLSIYGISKTDFGYPNNPVGGANKFAEPLKEAATDAFKRAAVLWGPGREFYTDISNYRWSNGAEDGPPNGHASQRDTPVGAGVGTAPPEPPSNALDSPLKVPIKREMLAICHQEQIDSQDVLEWLQKTLKFSGPISGQLHATQERILAALMERRLKVTA